MPLAHKFDATNLVIAHIFKRNSRDELRAVMARVATALVFMALTCIFAAGHPIIAIWAGFAIVYWTFFVGAFGDSGNYPGHGKVTTLPSTSPKQQVEAASRRKAIYEDMLRVRGLKPKQPTSH